jgi:phosphoglycolate phosphatase
MYSADRLIILDADGTTIDAFAAIAVTFARHGMQIGDLTRFQKRRKLFKYLGGLKELPKNLKKQLGKEKRKQLVDTLTEVYREEAQLYPGIADLIRRLMATSDIRVGLVTRNITREPKETLRQLFARHRVDTNDLDFLVHLPLSETKVNYFRAMRQEYAVNPARAYACGDERKDFEAAIATGIHPFMVSYGFENFDRLTRSIGVPTDVISQTPEELRQRVLHALDLDAAPPSLVESQPLAPSVTSRLGPVAYGAERLHLDDF